MDPKNKLKPEILLKKKASRRSYRRSEAGDPIEHLNPDFLDKI